jgi:hypothetical protein
MNRTPPGFLRVAAPRRFTHHKRESEFMEMFVSGPLKALGWLFVFLGVVSFLFIDNTPKSSSILAAAVGGGLVWAGRWVSAVREARLQKKYERHHGRAESIRRHID